MLNQKIKNIQETDEFIKNGFLYFQDSLLKLGSFEEVEWSSQNGFASWELNPLSNRSWQWRLNWLSFLSFFIAHHKKTSDLNVLKESQKVIDSWLSCYRDTDTTYPFEFVWHDHATALRAEQMLFFYFYAQKEAPEYFKAEKSFFESLLTGLRLHGEWLAKDSFYSKHTNHGLEQARVLLLLGWFLDDDQGKIWQKVARHRLASELDFAFTSEGVHVENSPAYHIFVFKVFSSIIQDYPSSLLGELSEKFSVFSEKALGFTTYILRPDGFLPPIGDTEQIPTSYAYRDDFGSTSAYQAFSYAHSKGVNGVRPSQLNKVLAKSGYAIFRDAWPDTKHYQDAFHIVTKVGTSSRYHHQQDEGHVSVFAGGEDWLIDSGLYNFINKDPIRKYMRSRAAHNVPAVSDTHYPKEFEDRLTAWKVLRFSEDEIKPFIEMQLDVLEPVRQVRKVEFDSFDKVLTINDLIAPLEDNDQQLRNFMFNWHIPQDKKIKIEGDRVFVTSPSGQLMKVTMSGCQADNVSVAKGEKDDRVFSYISYKANQVESSQVLRFWFKGHRTLDISFKFDFSLNNPLPCEAVSCIGLVSDKENPTDVFPVYYDSKTYRMKLPNYKTDYIQGMVANGHSPYEVIMLEKMSLGLGKDDFVLDIGANIGNHALFFLVF
ncbi:MAG: heparinase II/III family protein [Pseudomonadota bacterium]|nr:heparinase II/III family protein [Pseudomonadota bacterium]